MSGAPIRPVIHRLATAKAGAVERDRWLQDAHRHCLSLSAYLQLILTRTTAQKRVLALSAGRLVTSVPSRVPRRRFRRILELARLQCRPVLLRGSPSPGIGWRIRGHRLEPFQLRFRDMYAVLPVPAFPRVRLPLRQQALWEWRR